MTFTRTLSLVLILAVTPANPSTRAAGGERAADAAARVHELDGSVFRGPVGMNGKPARRDDTFIFSNGTFISENCRQHGFVAGPYETIREEDAVRFRARLESASEGTMHYEGRIQGDAIEATFSWVKSRWYWTIEREFWFSGRKVNDR